MIGILICSCHKDDDYLESQNVENSNFENFNGAKKLENSYTVENMRIALENIKKNSNNKQLSNLEIVTSHYYIKFMPETEEQESIIKRDTTMILSDYPLDWEFTDEYLDNRPQLLEGEFPEYWVAVPIDKILPNEVPFEILEELYIPEQDPLFDDESENSEMGYTQKNKINNNVDLLKNLLNEAFTLTGNEGDLNEKKSDAQTNWIFGSKWYPSGTLKIWDDNAGTSIVRTRVFSHWEYYDCNEDGPGEPSEPGMQAYSSRVEEELCRVAIYRYINNTVQGKYVPLVGAQVLIRQWFTVRQGITDHNGYFRTGSVRGKARYILQWERYHYSIRNGSLFQAETRGPKVKEQAWNLNIRGGDDEYHGMIHTAAHIYYYGSRFGLTSPPTNSFWKKQMKIAAREQNGTSSHIHQRRWTHLAQIHIKEWGEESQQVFGTTIHELAHAAHWAMDRNAYNSLGFNGYVGGNNGAKRTLETWATTVEIAFALQRYKHHFNQPNYRYKHENFQYRLISDSNFYTSAGWDMIDDFNQKNTYGTAYPIDRVSGYTIKQLEDALRGVKTWAEWRNRIKNLYNNVTEEFLFELFNNWE